MTHADLQAALTARTPHWDAGVLSRLTGLSERWCQQMIDGKRKVDGRIAYQCVWAGRY